MLNENTTGEPLKRPDLLKLLCILTFIGSGLASVSNMFIYLSFDEILLLKDEYVQILPEMETILSGGKRFFLTGFIFYTLSLFGALNMWKMRKIGFHLYTGAQIFILILPVVFIESYPFSFIGLIVTAIFVGAYASNLKFMKS